MLVLLMICSCDVILAIVCRRVVVTRVHLMTMKCVNSNNNNNNNCNSNSSNDELCSSSTRQTGFLATGTAAAAAAGLVPKRNHFF